MRKYLKRKNKAVAFIAIALIVCSLCVLPCSAYDDMNIYETCINENMNSSELISVSITDSDNLNGDDDSIKFDDLFPKTPAQHHEQLISRVNGYLRGLGESLKNAFVGFVYEPDGRVSSSFATALSYIVLAVSICAIVAVISIFTRKGD